MPAFSCFTPLGGGLAFSSEKPKAQQIYEELVLLLGGGANFSDDFDSVVAARLYACAMSFAAAFGTIARAGEQFDPTRAYELLPQLEREVGRLPLPGENVTERQQQVAALLKAPRGARYSNVAQVLETALGDVFVEYVPTPNADALALPADPTTAGVYVPPGTRRTAHRTLDDVGVLGSPVSIDVSTIAGSRKIRIGDRVVIEPGSKGRREVVTVTAASSDAAPANAFTAVFTKCHPAGSVVVGGRHPQQIRTKRHSIVKLTEAGVLDSRVRRITHDIMHRTARGVSTWSLTDGSGPFRVGVGRIGVTTIGEA